jgi:hypothetical protein
VFFTSTQKLTNEASEDPRKDDSAFQFACYLTNASAPGCNLYEMECPDHCENGSQRHIIDVSAGDISGLGPQVQGVIAIPSDGSDVYFVAHGVLTGANSSGAQPVPGADNLYVYSDGEGPGHLEFIATLAEADETLWTKNDGLGIADVTPDGRFLVFPSHLGLTPDATRAEGPSQIYRYDASSGQLIRLSVGSHGFNNNGNASAGDARIVEAEKAISLGVGAGRPDPTMSDDGRFVFFQSPAGLAPGALDNEDVLGNNKILAQNIYEWAEQGASLPGGGSPCSNPSGCVSLISDGKDNLEGAKESSTVELLGASASGADVFFWTADQLVPADVDTQLDIYDARVGGGLPPPVETTPCASSGECHSATAAPPVLEGALSESFSGPGNPPLGAEESTHGGETLPKHTTPAQKLAKNLAGCRTLSPRGARGRCENKARKTYRAESLSAALTQCHKKRGRTRAACEHKARSKYGAKSSGRKRVGR